MPEAVHALQQANPVSPVLLSKLIAAEEEVPIISETEPVIPEIMETVEVEDELLIQPASADDYFLQQGIHVSNELPETEEIVHHEQTEEEKEKALMVVMSFSEWLKHISSHNKKAKEEEADKKALKTMWQQQKLAAAIEEESDEIPEQVFEMAVNSISRKDELVSESLAEVYAKQGKKEKAIGMYQKLSLLNPEKNTYFAAKIENLQKDL
jgi:tetratricopeptide (TPR) repeat protein